MLGRVIVAILIGLLVWFVCSLVAQIAGFAALIGLLVGLAVFFLASGL